MLALKKPCVIFTLNGGSVAMEPELAAPNAALIEAFYPGQQGAPALARAIFGVDNKWGKMPFTVYKAEWAEKNSIFEHDVAASGRTYRYGASKDALVPFGFGSTLLPIFLVLPVGSTGSRRLPLVGKMTSIGIEVRGCRDRIPPLRPTIWVCPPHPSHKPKHVIRTA